MQYHSWSYHAIIHPIVASTASEQRPVNNTSLSGGQLQHKLATCMKDTSLSVRFFQCFKFHPSPSPNRREGTCWTLLAPPISLSAYTPLTIPVLYVDPTISSPGDRGLGLRTQVYAAGPRTKVELIFSSGEPGLTCPPAVLAPVATWIEYLCAPLVGTPFFRRQLRQRRHGINLLPPAPLWLPRKRWPRTSPETGLLRRQLSGFIGERGKFTDDLVGSLN